MAARTACRLREQRPANEDVGAIATDSVLRVCRLGSGCRVSGRALRPAGGESGGGEGNLGTVGWGGVGVVRSTASLRRVAAARYWSPTRRRGSAPGIFCDTGAVGGACGGG